MSGQQMINAKQVDEGDQVAFTFSKPLYDLTTYVGRFKNILASTNPLLFLVSKQKIYDSQDLLKRYKEEENAAKNRNERYMLTKAQVKEIIKADSIVRSAIHPDSGDLIPRYMRFTAYLYANIPINFGMLLTAPTTFNIVLWQWINQTYYVGVNYSNRNASSKFTNQDLAKAYFIAWAASIGVGLGIKNLIGPFEYLFKGSKAFFFMFTISFIANSAANGTNLLVIRNKEFREGIPVLTKDGEEVGISKKVGRSAVLQTALTRCMMPVLPLGLPTISFYLLDKMKMIPKNKVARVIQQTVVFTYSIMFSPAAAWALFPQMSKIDAAKLEPEFHNLRDKDGSPVTELY